MRIISKILVLFSVIICSQNLYSASPDYGDELKTVVCIGGLAQAVDAHLKTQSWVPEPISIPRKPLINGIAFRDSRTKKYYKIWSFKNETSLLEGDLKSKEEILKTWNNLKACALTQEKRKAPEFPSFGKVGFSDAELDKTLNANPWGVIYVWTPYMPLSVEGLKEIRDAVHAKGGNLTVLLDPKADPVEAKKWIGKGATDADLNPATSDELNSREMGLHYPIAFIYKNKFLSNRTYVGFKYNNIYQKWIDIESAELAKDMK